jgi:hypothetical protein
VIENELGKKRYDVCGSGFQAFATNNPNVIAPLDFDYVWYFEATKSPRIPSPFSLQEFRRDADVMVAFGTTRKKKGSPIGEPFVFQTRMLLNNFHVDCVQTFTAFFQFKLNVVFFTNFVNQS